MVQAASWPGTESEHETSRPDRQNRQDRRVDAGSNTSRVSRRRRRSRSAALTRDVIIDAAIELAEQEGLGALSTRRIGDHLGVDPTAYYRYFRNKDELILALGDRLRLLGLERARAELTAESSWDEVLRSLARSVWEVSMQHPAVHALTFARTSGGLSEREGAELIMATLSAAGLSRADTVMYYRTFVVIILSISGEFAVRASLDDEARANQYSIWPSVYGSLPAEQYPVAHVHARELLDIDDDREIYMNAVESLLSDIARRIT